jgi:UDP-glucose:O-linked fucose beta-1,3-glucosyltransferase
LKQDERNLTSEISSTEASIRTIQSKINKLEQESLKQKAILYAQDFQIEQLDKKVRRAMGERTDDEREELEKQIKELSAKLENEHKVSNVLKGQLRKLQDDLRYAFNASVSLSVCQRKRNSFWRKKKSIFIALCMMSISILKES